MPKVNRIAERKNVLRELIKSEKPTIGTHVHSIWPGVVEVIGHSGAMDYVEFTGQYAPYDLFSLENFGRAVDLFDHMSSMIKLDQEPRLFQAERAVGSGIQNLLFADIRTVDDAKEAVAGMRAETPNSGGLAGVSMTRDMGYVFPNVDLPDFVKATQEGVVAIMIEKQPAIENLDEILSVEGVDMVQFGPGDYSMSIGIAGNYDHPDIKNAEKLIIETCLKKGIRPRVEINEWEEAKPYMDMGVIDFCIGWDLTTIYGYCQEQGEGLSKLLGR